jgi:hypothetical protein
MVFTKTQKEHNMNPNRGMKVRTGKLGSTMGFIIHPKHIAVRQANITGVVRGWVPGHGGDVWFVQHDNSDDIGVYSVDEMEVQIRTFEVETVLSITTGTLLTDIGNVYDILNYMTGDSLFTHQLPKAAEVCGPVLLGQHPMLKHALVEGVGRNNWLWHVHDKRRKFGNYLQVLPLSGWTHTDPFSDLVEMIGTRSEVDA